MAEREKQRLDLLSVRVPNFGLAASVAERLSKHSVVGRRMRHGLRAWPR